jgi:hypothetical protein
MPFSACFSCNDTKAVETLSFILFLSISFFLIGWKLNAGLDIVLEEWCVTAGELFLCFDVLHFIIESSSSIKSVTESINSINICQVIILYHLTN